MASDQLTEQQERFCHEFVRTLNGTRAAILAGYAPTRAAETASELKSKPHVADRIAELEAERLGAIDASAEGVLRELVTLARFDARQFFDELGNVKPPTEWTAEMGAALASFEVQERKDKSNPKHVDTILKIKTWPKTPALEALAKHLGLVKDRTVLENPDGSPVKFTLQLNGRAST